jgi:hypothetical protein
MTFVAMVAVVDLGPHTPGQGLLDKQVHGMAQVLVTCPSFMAGPAWRIGPRFAGAAGYRASHPHGCVRALVFDKGLPGFGYPSIKTFAASESLNGFSEALRPDLLVFPFAHQEFDRSWRLREFLWRFSIRASQYKIGARQIVR